MSINERITLIRKRFKLNQEEFASKLMDYSQANISDIERGKVKPDIIFMEKLYNIYKISPEWLLTGNGEIFLNEKNTQLLEESFVSYGECKNCIKLEQEINKLKTEIIELKDELLEVYRPKKRNAG